jgi:hypothetical protein
MHSTHRRKERTNDTIVRSLTYPERNICFVAEIVRGKRSAHVLLAGHRPQSNRAEPS